MLKQMEQGEIVAHAYTHNGKILEATTNTIPEGMSQLCCPLSRV